MMPHLFSYYGRGAMTKMAPRGATITQIYQTWPSKTWYDFLMVPFLSFTERASSDKKLAVFDDKFM